MVYSITRAYSVSNLDVGTIAAVASTIDGAFEKLRTLSGGAFGSVFIAWHWENNKRVARAFGQAGKARWARPCTAKASKNPYNAHFECTTCGGLGLIEDVPS